MLEQHGGSPLTGFLCSRPRASFSMLCDTNEQKQSARLPKDIRVSSSTSAFTRRNRRNTTLIRICARSLTRSEDAGVKCSISQRSSLPLCIPCCQEIWKHLEMRLECRIQFSLASVGDSRQDTDTGIRQVTPVPQWMRKTFKEVELHIYTAQRCKKTS